MQYLRKSLGWFLGPDSLTRRERHLVRKANDIGVLILAVESLQMKNERYVVSPDSDFRYDAFFRFFDRLFRELPISEEEAQQNSHTLAHFHYHVVVLKESSLDNAASEYEMSKAEYIDQVTAAISKSQEALPALLDQRNDSLVELLTRS